SVFPFDDVMYFTINDPETVNSISKLTEGIFDVKSFGSVEIVGTMLETIEDNVLEYSHPTLFIFTLNNNKLQNFPFQTINLYEKLISLNLNNNELKEIPIFFSSTLRILSMNSNENLDFQSTITTFDGIPELRQLFLSNIGLKTLVPKMFQRLAYISDIYLSGNFLVE
ncbi:Leucine-rich repeat domain L domain-like, partial [Trinorchestia longiramus]